MPLNFHIPGRPKSPEPKKLVELVEKLHHSKVSRFGVTTTTGGAWALLAILKPGVKAPITVIEKKALKFPVIYQDDTGKLPEARPAYPSLGE